VTLDHCAQMLENWCWEEDPLRKLSGHYEDISKQLPEALLQSMIAAKNLDSGLMTLRQIFFGKFDLTVHTKKG